MESIWRDLRLGMRQLALDRGFSLAAILTLTLGIGAAATMFMVVDAILLRELPYRAPARLMMLKGSVRDKGEVLTWPISQMDFADWHRRCTVFSDMSIWGDLAFNLEQGQQSQHLWGELVNDSYFRLLGLRPELGRFFTSEEDARPLEIYVVVLGHRLWRSAFGADPGVLGRKVQLNGRLYQVVGVGPRGFRGLSDQADLFVPSMLTPIPGFVLDRKMRWVSGVARLRPEATVRQAQEQMDAVTAALAAELPGTNRGLGAAVTPLAEFWFGKLRIGLLVLLAGAGILLLIACVNVANLLLTRAVTRERGMGIRLALGASRWRLVRQLLAESLLLALIGAAAGLLLAHWAAPALIAASGSQLPSFVRVGAAPRVVLAIAGLAVLCGLGFGMAPIWISFRADVARSIWRDGGLAARGRGGRRGQSAVVVAQVALALTLSAGALLMFKGFRAVITQDLGFRPGPLLSFRIDPRGPKYGDDRTVVRLLREEYLRRIAAVPGVRQLAMSDPTIPTDVLAGVHVTIEDHASETVDGTYVAIIHAVSPVYFELLGIPLERGRAFDNRDTLSNAVIVSKAMAERQWPGQNPLGKRLKLGLRGRSEAPWLTVIGVAADVRNEGLLAERAPAPDVYLSLLQFIYRPPLTVNFLVRPQPGVSIARLRQLLHQEIMAIDPELPDYDMAALRERLARQTGKARFQVLLIGLFAVLALALAAIGIYGVISYGVAQRSREIAIRMSLGAGRGSILRMVVVRGAALATVGMALGLTGVTLLGGLLAGLPYPVRVADPLLLGAASLGLFLVTLAANYVPARRASVLDPMRALHLQ